MLELVVNDSGRRQVHLSGASSPPVIISISLSYGLPAGVNPSAPSPFQSRVLQD